MERVAQVLMHALARGLGLPDRHFDATFAGGISTLRLIHYAVGRPTPWLAFRRTSYGSRIAESATIAPPRQSNSGLMTLLAQDGVAGLQARAAERRLDQRAAEEGTLAVNFGKLLEMWTGGRIKATERRVIGRGEERYSIPFFYDARADALIEPLPLSGVPRFTPLFGDYLWSTMTKFVEFQGLEGLRRPQGQR